MTISLLDRAIYSYSDVDRLLGLHSGTARRRLDGYRPNGRFYEPVLREAPTGSDSVTSPKDQMALFLQHEERLNREIIKRSAGPWALALSPSGLQPLTLRASPGWPPMQARNLPTDEGADPAR